MTLVQRVQFVKCQMYRLAKNLVLGWTFYSLRRYRLCQRMCKLYIIRKRNYTTCTFAGALSEQATTNAERMNVNKSIKMAKQGLDKEISNCSEGAIHKMPDIQNG